VFLPDAKMRSADKDTCSAFHGRPCVQFIVGGKPDCKMRQRCLFSAYYIHNLLNVSLEHCCYRRHSAKDRRYKCER